MINSIVTPILKHIPTNTRLERIWKIAQVDFKKRYYNDKLGLLWALLNPLTQIGIYYFIFTNVFKRSEPNYAPYLFSALIIWLAFSQTTLMGAKLLYNKKYLIDNVQFNWLDLYTSHMVSATFGLAFNIMAYLITLVLLGNSMGTYFYLFPIVFITWFLISLGVSILLSLFRPKFEDIDHIWPLIIMVGLWVSGIFFDGSFYLTNYSWFLHINPFVGIILNTRACLLEGNEMYFNLLIENLVFAVILASIAIFLFNKNAKKVMELV